MYDDYVSHLCSSVTLRGSPPNDSNQDSSDSQQHFSDFSNPRRFDKWGGRPVDNGFSFPTPFEPFDSPAPVPFALPHTFANGIFAAGRGRKEKQHPSDAYWRDDKPVMTRVTIGSTTLQLPVVAPIDTDTLVKQTILERTIHRVEQTSKSPNDKVDILLQRFQDEVPDATLRIAMAMQEFDNYDTPLYEFTSLALVDGRNQLIDLGNGLGIPAEVRNQAAFFRITLQVRPKNCTQYDDVDISPDKFPDRFTKTTYVDVQ